MTSTATPQTNTGPENMVAPVGGIKCSLCGKLLKSKVALGGHTSRAHKGQSINYNKKVAVRARRKADREALAQAKKLVDKKNFPSQWKYKN